jgi:hypothetical protein
MRRAASSLRLKQTEREIKMIQKWELKRKKMKKKKKNIIKIKNKNK